MRIATAPALLRRPNLGGEAGNVAATVDGVRRRDEERSAAPLSNARLTASAEPEHARLAHEAELEPESRTVARKPLDLLGEVTGHEPDAPELGCRELSQEDRQHRPPVDRQHRLRPPLGERAESHSLPRRHDDGVHR